MSDSRVERIVLIRLSALGDVVHTLWGLAALRRAWPDATIGYVVEDGPGSLLRDHPHVDRLHILPRGAWKKALRTRGALLSAPSLGAGASRFVSELRAGDYQVAVDLQGNLRSSLVTRSSGAARRLGPGRGHGKEGSILFLTEPVDLPDGLHRVERGLALIGAAMDTDLVGERRAGAPGPDPEIADPPESVQLAERLLAEVRGGSSPSVHPVVAFHPGVSGFGAFKVWREDGWVALGARLVRDHGARIVVSWGPGEDELATRIAERIVARVGSIDGDDGASPVARPSPPTRSVLDLAAILRRVDLAAASDTGPLHLASALGTPVVGLYGSKDPAVYGPFGPGARTVTKGVPCSPCRQRSCVRPDCMNLITADEVTASALTALQGATS